MYLTADVLKDNAVPRPLRGRYGLSAMGQDEEDPWFLIEGETENMVARERLGVGREARLVSKWKLE